MMKIVCECGKALLAKDTHAGRSTRCPSCGENIRIPHNEPLQQLAAIFDEDEDTKPRSAAHDPPLSSKTGPKRKSSN
jgi:hypothetical protein